MWALQVELIQATARLVAQIATLNRFVCSDRGFSECIPRLVSSACDDGEGEGWGVRGEDWGGGDSECRRLLVRCVDTIDGVAPGLKGLTQLGGSLGSPPLLLRCLLALAVISKSHAILLHPPGPSIPIAVSARAVCSGSCCSGPRSD